MIQYSCILHDLKHTSLYTFVYVIVHSGGYTASCAAMSYPDIGAVVSIGLLFDRELN